MVLIDSPTDLIATASRQIPQLDMKMERFGLAATGVRESYMIEWREDIRQIICSYDPIIRTGPIMCTVHTLLF